MFNPGEPPPNTGGYSMARRVSVQSGLKTAAGWERAGRIVDSGEFNNPSAFWVSDDGWTYRKMYSVDQTLGSEDGRAVTIEEWQEIEEAKPNCEARYAG